MITATEILGDPCRSKIICQNSRIRDGKILFAVLTLTRLAGVINKPPVRKGILIMKNIFHWPIVLLLLSACCGSLPVQPVENFELNRYVGKWYEIARLDHFFERGLEQVTADYSLRTDGGIRVVNRGYSAQQNEWSQAEGKAYFRSSPETGLLKVSFFGPLYSPYIIFGLDSEYQYAYVAGPDLNYLWLLSRTPTVDKSVYDDFVATAEEQGFDVSSLIQVQHQ